MNEESKNITMNELIYPLVEAFQRIETTKEMISETMNYIRTPLRETSQQINYMMLQMDTATKEIEQMKIRNKKL